MGKAIVRAGLTMALLLLTLHGQPVLAQTPVSTGVINGTVTDTNGQPVASASVTLTGVKTSMTQSDAHGLFTFVNVPYGIYAITVTAPILGTVTRSNITINGDINISIAYNASVVNGLKDIASTSTSANANFNIGFAAMLTVNPTQAAFDGNTKWTQILAQIPGVTFYQGNNANTPYSSISNSPFNQEYISIGGGLQYETATLLDGMPLYGRGIGNGTDLSAFPLNGFSAADIVRGPGGDSPSIMDSIGGTLVLHPASTVQSTQYNLSMGTDPYGGIISNLEGTLHLRKLSVAFTYGVNDSPGPRNNAALIGNFFPVGSTLNGLPVTCAGGPFDFNCECPPTPPPYADRTGNQVNSIIVCCTQLNSAWSQHSGSFALSYNFSSKLTASIYSSYQEENENMLPQEQIIGFTPPPGYAGNPSPGPVGLGGFVPGYADTYFQMNRLLEEKVSAQIGSGLFQVAALQNFNYFDTSCNFPLFSGQYVQLFGGGIAGDPIEVGGVPTVFNGGTYLLDNPGAFSVAEDSQAYSQNRDLLFSYTSPLGTKAHFGISNVYSFYNEYGRTLEFCDGFPQGIGNGQIGGSTPSYFSTTNQTRLSFGENLSDKTSLELSYYLANVQMHVPNPTGCCDPLGLSSTGWLTDTFHYAAPRLGFVWRPTAAISVRAAAGGGFAIAQLAHYIGSSGLISCNPPGNSICSQTLTNNNLQPEHSFAWDVGADIRLKHDTVFSFDAYLANLFGEVYRDVSNLGPFTGPQCTAVGGCTLNTSIYGNLAQTRMEGMVVELRHSVPHGIYWDFSGGVDRSYVVSVPAGFYNSSTTHPCNQITGQFCANLSVIPGPNFNADFATSIPYSQGSATLGYRWSPQKYLNLSAIYYGPNNFYLRPAFVVLNGAVSFTLRKNLTLLTSFNNITNVYGANIFDQPDTELGPPGTESGRIWDPPVVYGKPIGQNEINYSARTVQVTLQMHL